MTTSMAGSYFFLMNKKKKKERKKEKKKERRKKQNKKENEKRKEIENDHTRTKSHKHGLFSEARRQGFSPGTPVSSPPSSV